MDTNRPWHETDEFWTAAECVLFHPERVQAAKSQLDLLLPLLNLARPATVLDLCCGIGRHSLELARRGFTVTGVDRTRHYLEKARAQATAEGLSVEFVEADMRQFRRQAAFDLVINLYTSFGYFDDPAEDMLVAQNILASLKPGGQVLFEMIGKEILARVFRPSDWMERGDGVLILEQRRVVDDWARSDARWIIFEGDQRREVHINHRLYSAVELKNLLKSTGFVEVTAFGGLDGSPYDHTAKRLVVRARHAI